MGFTGIEELDSTDYPGVAPTNPKRKGVLFGNGRAEKKSGYNRDYINTSQPVFWMPNKKKCPIRS